MSSYIGSSGNDVFTGGIDNDTATGAGGDDALTGAAGNDLLVGGAGADTLDGGDDSDTLYSGDQSPPFTPPWNNNPWTAPLLDTGVEQDTLNGGAGSDGLFAGYGDNVDGGAGSDSLYISFMGSTSGVTADFRQTTLVIGGGTITNIEIVAWMQGSNAADDITLNPSSSGGAYNYLFGMGGDDHVVSGYYTEYMDGGDGDDVLDGRPSTYLSKIIGGAGDDTLYTSTNGGSAAYGGDGNDTIYSWGDTFGGAGDDVIVIGSGSYPGSIYGEAGDDHIQAGNNGGVYSGGQGADTLIGGASQDYLIATDRAGNPYFPSWDVGIEHDVLNGAGGDDFLSAGYGDDIDGGVGTDTLYLSLGGAASGVTLNIAGILSGQPVTVGGGVIKNIETLAGVRGSSFNDTFIITNHSTALTLDGGVGADTADYSAYSVGVSINLVAGAGPGGDQLFGVENIDGTALNDLLNGDNYNANVLRGLAGDDVLSGGLGDDVLTGGAGIDILTGGGDTDLFRDTAAGFNGDTITDLSIGERIEITDADIANFSFTLNGSTLTYTGGALTLGVLPPTGYRLAASAAAQGVALSVVRTPMPDNGLSGDFNGDGRSDLLWRSDAGQLSNWLARADGGFVGNDANAYATVSTSWHVVGAGDFNGDGKDDIVWRSDSGQLSDWLGKANGGFIGNDGNALTTVSTAWQVAGVGDFNGDGRDDLVWRSDSGQMSDWLGQVNGGFVGNDANAFRTVGTDWHIVGVGDFNGDHRDDILWRSDQGQLSNWLGQANGGFTGNDANAFVAVSTDWHVVGVGDFNGDGRGDILWRSDAGQMSNWLGTASGGWAGNDVNAFTTVSTDWVIAGVGDYNGDGRDDIVWRNTTNGAMSDWLARADGGFNGNDANAYRVVDPSWHIQVSDLFAI